MDDTLTSDSTVTVAVVPPTAKQLADFDQFDLAVCLSPATTGCPVTQCSPAQATACLIGSLTPGATYSISATAVKGSTTSLVGTPDTVTLRYP